MKAMKLKLQIEAILFHTDKPVKVGAIARLVNQDVQSIRQSLLELIHEYEERDSALEIATDDDGYIIQVKDEYAGVIDEIAPMELPAGLLRTLSAIAIKQPVAQSDIIKIRGAGAYDHVRELINRELILKREDGRSPVLSTTQKFQEYFRLSGNARSLRTQLKKENKDAEETIADPATPEILEKIFQSSPDDAFVFKKTEAHHLPADVTTEPSEFFEKEPGT